MTPEEFNSLPAFAQEEFINKGGTISNLPTVAIEPTRCHSLEIANEVQQEGIDLAIPPAISTKESSHNNDSPLAVDYTEGFDIKDPVELLLLLDDELSNGMASLHPWQIQFMLDFAHVMHNKDHPFKAIVRAANGSGKDKYIVAACAVWLCMRFKKARCVITNGSGVQLDNQTEHHINALALASNRKFAGGKALIWKCNYRYYECLPTESPSILFATDEEGKAEGYHPIDPGRKMAIFASEAKSIPDKIFEALNRCSGYTHKVEVSSPGQPMGHFFEMDSTAISREDLKDIKSIKPVEWIKYLITAYDCPHISQMEIEQFAADLPQGKNSPVFKSGILAEFGGLDAMVVVQYRFVNAASKIEDEHWIVEDVNKAGLDLSDGGDETVLAVRNGNKIIRLLAFRFDNTQDTINYLDEQFRECGLDNPKSFIFGDAGGLGKPILDSLKAKGWSNIRYRDNRAKSLKPNVYRNWGAESWFNFGRLLEKGAIILPPDKKLMTQISTRYYKIQDGQIHQLLSKLEMKSRGYPSPDRADACVLAFSDYAIQFPSTTNEDVPFKEATKAKATVLRNSFTLKDWANSSEHKSRFSVNDGQKNFSYLQEEVADYNKNKKLEQIGIKL